MSFEAKVHAGEKVNRLIDEASPYLLQHARNPVDWYPWGDEAFERARREDKPIFLSTGYSTCHWCHVMAEESFSDPETARIMNEHFVCIKVDREERPDVDAVYMKAVQALTGSGGWPMSVFLTPEGEPFYGGTYFPPADRGSMPAFKKVLTIIADAWENKREDISNSVGRIMEYLTTSDQAEEGDLSAAILDRAFKSYSKMFDRDWGGFSSAPKFPQPSCLSMLMVYYYRTGERHSLEMTELTLKSMADGGIHDQLGGGFHRYSTDSEWLVPHFEKMLYDQALLSRAYIQAYQITGKKVYARTARKIFDYVLRDMTDDGGAFYSAEDADSEGAEGTFYLWDKDQTDSLLGADARVFNAYYGVTEDGNFDGRNILHVTGEMEELAKSLSVDAEELEEIIERSEEKLFGEREKRVRPHRDEKIIAGWNGLMISSLAYGGAVLADDRYIKAAGQAADFVLSKLNTDNRLKRFYAKGKARTLGVLNDYAFLITGLVELYQADFNVKWLSEAKRLAGKMITLFADEKEGGFFLTGSDAEKLITEGKEAYDVAIPSGNSAAVRALLALGRITMDGELTDEAERVLAFFSGSIEELPASVPEMLIGVDYYFGPDQEIVIAGEKDSADTSEMLREVRKNFLPRAVVILHEEGGGIENFAEFVKMQKPVDGKAAAYVCEDYTCRLPVTDLEDLHNLLERQQKRK